MKFLSVLCLFLILISCKAKEEDKTAGKVDLLPSVTELVAKAEPSGLTAASIDSSDDSFWSAATAAEATEALKDFFNDNVMSISGKTGKGLIKTYLSDLDSRVTEIENVSEAPPCYSAATTDVTFNSGITNQSLTLKLSCAKKFGGNGDKAGEGSGMAFGQDATHYYMYLLLIQENLSDKFGYVAKINKTTEEVDLMFLERFPTYNRTKIFRLRTKPTEKKYELNIAGTGDGPGPTQTATTHVLSPGARIVTSSTEIKVNGSVAASTTAAGAASPAAFLFDAAECFSATNLSTAPTTCTGSLDFSSDMALFTGANVNAVSTNINTALQTITALIALGITQL